MPDLNWPQLITSVIVIVTIIHIILLGCAYLILLERKLSAWMQDRVGPNRVGPKGFLQPIADGLKFILKEDYFPNGVDFGMFLLAPGIIIVPALIGFGVLPFGGTLDLSTVPFMNLTGTVEIVGANVNIGLIYLVAVASLGVYGVALGGWASNNKFSFLGGLRASAQMISYEIPMGLAILAIVLTAGTIDPGKIVNAQVEGQWFIVQQPIAALLLYICMLAESNRAPFDLAEAESELVGGYHTEYSSMKFALFFLAEYAHMIVGSAFFAVLFLGGWSLNPFFGIDLPIQGGLGLITLQVGVVLFKVFLIVSLTMAVRWTLPRFRYDQLMRLAWEGLIPTALLVVMVTSVFVYFGWTPYMWLGSLASVVIVWLVYPLMPRQASPNRRLPLVGSRFSPLHDTDVRTAPTDPIALSDAAIPETM